MGLGSARKLFSEALITGNFSAIERLDDPRKNLLATAQVDAIFVANLIQSTKGDEYEERPHDSDPHTTIHIWKPKKGKIRWYVKAFYRDHAWFLSVHKSEFADENFPAR